MAYLGGMAVLDRRRGRDRVRCDQDHRQVVPQGPSDALGYPATIEPADPQEPETQGRAM